MQALDITIREDSAGVMSTPAPVLFAGNEALIRVQAVLANGANRSLPAGSTFYASLDSDLGAGHADLTVVTNDRFNIAGDWPETNLDEGRFCFRLSTNTPEIVNYLDGKPRADVILEVWHTEPSGERSVLLQTKLAIKNTTSDFTPVPVQGVTYATTDDLDNVVFNIGNVVDLSAAQVNVADPLTDDAAMPRGYADARYLLVADPLTDDFDAGGNVLKNAGALETSVIASQNNRAFDIVATGPMIGGGLAAGESTVVAQGEYIYVAGTQWRTTYRANERYLYISAGVAQGAWEYADYGTVAVADVPYTGAVVGQHYVVLDQRGAGFSGSLGSPAIGTCQHAATLQADAITIAYRVMCAPYAPMFGGWQSALHATGMLSGMSPDRHYYETATIGKSAASWSYQPHLLPHDGAIEMLIAFVPLQDNQTSSSLRFDNPISAWSLVLSSPGTITAY